MARNLDTGLLRTFAAVADTGGMTAAANLLNLTQGAVSQQVRRLEEQLGRDLFERGRGGLRLTPAGERMLGRARRLLALNDEIWAEMTAPDFAGRVRLGVPYDLVGTLLPPVLKSFARACPRVEVALTCAASPLLDAALAGGTLDLALVEEPAATAPAGALAVEPLVWVGARGGGAHLRRPLPLSLVSDSCAFRPSILAALGAAGRDWRMVFEAGDLEATRAVVRMDMAVSAWLAATVPADLEVLDPGAAGLPDLPAFAVSLRAPRAGAAPAARELARHLRDALGPARAAVA